VRQLLQGGAQQLLLGVQQLLQQVVQQLLQVGQQLYKVGHLGQGLLPQQVLPLQVLGLVGLQQLHVVLHQQLPVLHHLVLQHVFCDLQQQQTIVTVAHDPHATT
jgi:hypothetical protein